MAKQKRVRSPRYSVPNNEQVLVSIDNKQVKGKLELLSLTGGAVRLDKRFAAGTLGDIGIKTVSGNVTAAVQLLDMARGKGQAFRFLAMGTADRARLADALKKARVQGLAVDKGPLDHIRSFAQQVVSLRFR